MMDIKRALTGEGVDRRAFLEMGICAAAGAVALPAAADAAVFKNGKIIKGARRISFHNTHTDESFSGVYRVGNKYLPDAFDSINYVLRDYRTDEIFPIDPRVLDIIYTVHRMTGSREPYEIISGYRSPKTNAMLRKASTGVAKNSLHMSGRAIDLRLPGYSTQRLRNVAINLRAGGVGYYPGSDFVHMDSGDIRHW